MMRDPAGDVKYLLDNFRSTREVIRVGVSIANQIPEQPNAFLEEQRSANRGVRGVQYRCDDGGTKVWPALSVCMFANQADAVGHVRVAAEFLWERGGEGISPGRTAFLVRTNDGCEALRSVLCPIPTFQATPLPLLTTIHKSKGLERDVVFVLFEVRRRGWKRGGDGELEFWNDENRRIMYVAATRAKSAVHLVFYGSRFRCVEDMEEMIGDLIGEGLYREAKLVCPCKAVEESTVLDEGVDVDVDAGPAGAVNGVEPSVHAEPSLQPPVLLANEPSVPWGPSTYPILTQLSQPTQSSQDTDIDATSLEPTHKLPPTKIAYYAMFTCERKLHLDANKRRLPTGEEVGGKGKKKKDKETSGFAWLVKTRLDAGDEWEAQIATYLKEHHWLSECPHTKIKPVTSSLELYQYLSTVPTGMYVHGLYIIIPISINQRLFSYTPDMPSRPGLNEMEIDFLRMVETPDGKRAIQVLDAKYTEHVEEYQKIQIAIYYLVMTAMLEEHAAGRTLTEEETLHMSRRGYIWNPIFSSSSMPGRCGIGIQRGFNLPPVAWSVRRFLQEELPRVFSPEGFNQYHLQPVCRGCDYYGVCEGTAKEGGGHLSLIPGISKGAVKELCEAGVGDIESLAGLSLDAPKVSQQLIHRARAVLEKKARFLDRRTKIMPANENVKVVICLQTDRIYKCLTFAAIATRGTMQWTDSMDISYFPKTLDDLFLTLYDKMERAKQSKLSLQIYFGQNHEFELFRDHLMESLVSASERDGRRYAKLSAIVRTVIMGTQFSVQTDNPGDPLSENRSYVVLLTELSHIVGLPRRADTMRDVVEILTSDGGQGVSGPGGKAQDKKTPEELITKEVDVVFRAIDTIREFGTLEQSTATFRRTLTPFDFKPPNHLTNRILSVLYYLRRCDVILTHEESLQNLDDLLQKPPIGTIRLVPPTTQQAEQHSEYPCNISSDLVSEMMMWKSTFKQ
ncbi:Tripartite DNA replication factor [Rhizophlyctis rosea]|nr:Tripartite DNA replication factor [Rhizophlyctis rosea]